MEILSLIKKKIYKDIHLIGYMINKIISYHRLNDVLICYMLNNKKILSTIFLQILFITTLSLPAHAQFDDMKDFGGRGNSRGSGKSGPSSIATASDSIAPEDRFRVWRLTDDFTHVDSIAVDTITDGFQIYNPILKNSFSNVWLGNVGSPYVSNLLSAQNYGSPFFFLNTVDAYFGKPEDIVYFNTRVPYTNITYIYSPPRSRPEENVRIFFTQNINSTLNFGFHYDLISAKGKYSYQKINNRKFIFFLDYSSYKYSLYASYFYNKNEREENGGLDNNNLELITNSEKYNYEQPYVIPMNYDDGKSGVYNNTFFVHQSLDIGKIKIRNKDFKHQAIKDTTNIAAKNTKSVNNKKNSITLSAVNKNKSNKNTIALNNDSINISNTNTNDSLLTLPIASVFHTLKISKYEREFNIDKLSSFVNKQEGIYLPLYKNVYADSISTADTTLYYNIHNFFQIKFKEEANPILRFGLRGFIGNDIDIYKFQVQPTFYKDKDTEKLIPNYNSHDTVFVNTYIGGQIFKNLGKNFWWNAGGKIWIQGYKLGDIQLKGELNTLYRIKKDTAGVFANALLNLKEPDFLLEKFYSNHFKWDNNFKKSKSIAITGGIKIPTRKLTLTWHSKSLTDYIYWGYDAVPVQTSKLITAFELSLKKDITWGPFHSNNKLAYQFTSDKEIYPLPDFTGISSNYFNFYVAKKVLQIQLGIDVRYHTKYYTPAYMPALGQFHLQKDYKVGNYPFLDAFVNLHLKRARIFVKLDHFNEYFSNKDYFLTYSYPYQPFTIKWGVSWNFYD